VFINGYNALALHHRIVIIVIIITIVVVVVIAIAIITAQSSQAPAAGLRRTRHLRPSHQPKLLAHVNLRCL
jgi:flagellar basal body-associated protein FliL